MSDNAIRDRRSPTWSANLPAIILLAIAALLLVLYVGDYALVRFRVAHGGMNSVLSTVTVFYATPIKGGKVSVFYGQPEIEPCIRALFPELTYAPCWYVRRHTIRVIY